ncbi:MAG: flavin reductase family protein [Clostridia bacterium]|nr:flavin reductase family protein [Clostridia bacterium]
MSILQPTPDPVTGRIEWKGSTVWGPAPAVMVSCGPLASPDIVTVSWTGLACTRPPMTYISLRPERFSHGLVRQAGCFVINFPAASQVYDCDFCGTYTGAKVDKFARLGLTAVPSATVSAPMIAECPISLSCEVRQIISLGSHDLFVAEIVGVSVAPDLLDRSGRLRTERADLLFSMHGAYYGVGRPLGRLGLCTKKQPAPRSVRPTPAGPKKEKKEQREKRARR